MAAAENADTWSKQGDCNLASESVPGSEGTSRLKKTKQNKKKKN